MARERSTLTNPDRRTYLKALGVGGVAGLGSVAGCVSVSDGGDEGNGGENGDTETTATATEGDTTTAEDGGDGTTTGGDGGGESTQIVAGTAPGFPPFEMKEGGELTGFDVELLEAVVGEAPGYQLQGWQEFEFSSLIPALQGDKIDVVAAAMTITDERDGKIDFTESYYDANQAIIVRAGGDFQPSELGDLSGRMVGAQEGTTGEEVVQSELIESGDLQQSNYKSYGNYVLSVQDLENGNIDAVVLDKPVAETFASQRDVEIAFVYETGEQYGFGVREDDDDLLQALNEGLAAVQDGGTYEELRNKWFGQSESTTESGS